MSTYSKPGRYKPTTQPDPLLHALFTEQERRGISNHRLAALSGVHRDVIGAYRHPGDNGGKRPTLTHVRAIAEALGYHFPTTLEELRK